MTNNVKCTMTNLTQRQIDRLDDYEYSLFLAYGDAYKPTPTVSSRTGSDQLWEAETSRFFRETRRQILRFRKRVRGVVNQRGFTLSDGKGRTD